MTAEEIREAYGSDEETAVTGVAVSPVITSVGVAPEMPKTAKVEYSSGLCQYETVTWDEIDKSSYAKKGEFEAAGKIEGAGTGSFHKGSGCGRKRSRISL